MLKSHYSMHKIYFPQKKFLKTGLKKKIIQKPLKNPPQIKYIPQYCSFMHKGRSFSLSLVVLISSLVVLMKKSQTWSKKEAINIVKENNLVERKIVYLSYVTLTSLDAAIWLIYSPSVKRIFCPSVWQSVKDEVHRISLY